MSTGEIVVLALFVAVIVSTLVIGLGFAARLNRVQDADDDMHAEHADDVTCPIPRINEDARWNGPRAARWYDTI